jgi:transposase
MKRRLVIEASKIKTWQLQLECGHTVLRREKGRGAPKRVDCEFCQMVLDRLELAEDWVTSRQVHSTHAVLYFLQKEGLVESSVAPHGGTIYWRSRGRKVGAQ